MVDTCVLCHQEPETRSYIFWMFFCTGYMEGDVKEVWTWKGSQGLEKRAEMGIKKAKGKNNDIYFAASSLECLCLLYLEGKEL